MVFHLTDKLRQKLRVSRLDDARVEVPPHLRWYANSFTAERVHYLIATNAASLYSVVWHGRGVRDDGAFLDSFLLHLDAQLDGDGMRSIFERCILPGLHGAALLKTQDRSVLGSMNDMVKASQFMLSHR